MELHFNCPKTGKAFATGEYRLIENHGIHADPRGGRVLRGKVALAQPCPYCGEEHFYRVDEVVCPLEASAWPEKRSV